MNMKKIHFENYTVNSYLQTFGINCVQYETLTAFNKNNTLLHCIMQIYNENELIDVYNTGYTIVQKNNNTYCVLLANNIVHENTLIACINYVTDNAN